MSIVSYDFLRVCFNGVIWTVYFVACITVILTSIHWFECGIAFNNRRLVDLKPYLDGTIHYKILVYDFIYVHFL